jgi:hypothetical protein
MRQSLIAAMTMPATTQAMIAICAYSSRRDCTG